MLIAAILQRGVGKPPRRYLGSQVSDLDSLNRLFYDTELSKNYDTEFRNLQSDGKSYGSWPLLILVAKSNRSD